MSATRGESICDAAANLAADISCERKEGFRRRMQAAGPGEVVKIPDGLPRESIREIIDERNGRHGRLADDEPDSRGTPDKTATARRIPGVKSSEANTSGTDRRAAVLDEVRACVCRDRQNTYGDAEDNFADIALRWTSFLRRRQIVPATAEVTAADVAAMMIDVKVARLGSAIDHPDNWVDAAGYAVCGGGIVESKRDEKA